MSSQPSTVIERPASEAAQRIVDEVKAVAKQETHCSFEIGKLAFEWKQLENANRTDAELAERTRQERSQITQRRLVHERFGDVCDTYHNLGWSHFYTALNWDDAEKWLKKADRDRLSVAKMREKREQSHSNLAGAKQWFEASRRACAAAQQAGHETAGLEVSVSQSSEVTQSECSSELREQGGKTTTASQGQAVDAPNRRSEKPKKKPGGDKSVGKQKSSQADVLRESVNGFRDSISNLQDVLLRSQELFELRLDLESTKAFAQEDSFDYDDAIKLTNSLERVLSGLEGRLEQCL